MKFSNLKALAVFLFLLAASPAFAAWPAGLQKAWRDTTAIRTLFFIEGMSCRACTVILHKKLNAMPGVYWARFNYPLRTLTIYHDIKVMPVEKVSEFVGGGELKAVPLVSKPAVDYQPTKDAAIASWKGGKIDVSEAQRIVKPFRTFVDAEMGDAVDEKLQVYYEILGEAARNMMLAQKARAEGFTGKEELKEYPRVVAKDFYYPSDAKPTQDEKAMAAFLAAKVLGSDPNEEARKFDIFLEVYYMMYLLEFRGELVESR